MRRDEKTVNMMMELERLQNELEVSWLDDSLPRDWEGLDYNEPIKRTKTRVTLRLDADMVRWFRKLGPGYGERINMVLRVYYCALLAGHIKGYPKDHTLPRIKLEASRIVEEGAARLRAMERQRDEAGGKMG